MIVSPEVWVKVTWSPTTKPWLLAVIVVVPPVAMLNCFEEAALEAGVAVFVEKPLALRYADGLDIVRVADEQQRILFVGHVLEYHPAIVRLRALGQEHAMTLDEGYESFQTFRIHDLVRHADGRRQAESFEVVAKATGQAWAPVRAPK